MPLIPVQPLKLLEQLKQLKQPPNLVKTVCDAVLILLSKELVPMKAVEGNKSKAAGKGAGKGNESNAAGKGARQGKTRGDFPAARQVCSVFPAWPWCDLPQEWRWCSLPQKRRWSDRPRCESKHRQHRLVRS